MAQQNGQQVSLEFAGGGLHVQKTLQFDPLNYEFSLTGSVTKDGQSLPSAVVWQGAFGDQSVAPDYIFGGMENVSATTQSDDDILHPAWAEPQANADDLVSHELGHQWYGDLLTTRDWSHVWLNEGFATFMEQTFHEADKGTDEGAYYRGEFSAPAPQEAGQ